MMFCIPVFALCADRESTRSSTWPMRSSKSRRPERQRIPMTKTVALTCLLSSCALIPAWIAPALEWDSFQLTTLKRFQSEQVLPDGPRQILLDAARPGLSAVLVSGGRVRKISGPKHEFLRNYAKSVGQERFAELYLREVEVAEQGRSYWIPMQEAVLEHFRSDVREREEATIALRYLGAAGEIGHFYVAIDYRSQVTNRLPMTTCFASELVGVQLGDFFQKTHRRLVERYGESFYSGIREQRQYYGFVIDRVQGTRLLISDAGEGYRRRVFSVQVSGPPNPDLPLYASLRLGVAPEAIEEVLGKSLRSFDSGEGYRELRYANSSCSVETKNGLLASLRIQSDPYYFEE